MDQKFISQMAISRRKYWIEEIVKLSGSFGADATRVEGELNSEYAIDGLQCLLDHLRLAGTIPETYGHDSSEEKLYSKYTDALLAVSFRHIGLTGNVLTERGDAADVDCVAEGYSFIADAKAFRMSRTAKNQKDFKIEAMASWKRGKPYAVVVCPACHLPSKSSQIYQQSAARSVAILTYAHLAVLCRYASDCGQAEAKGLLLDFFRAVEEMEPSKDAVAYWRTINAQFGKSGDGAMDIWNEEVDAAIEAINVSRQEALDLLGAERVSIEGLNHRQAIEALLDSHNIPGRIEKASSIADNGILRL